MKRVLPLIVFSKSGDSGDSAPFALTCVEDAQNRVRASKKGIALIVLNNSGDSGASAPFARAEDAQDRVRASTTRRSRLW